MARYGKESDMMSLTLRQAEKLRELMWILAPRMKV